MKIQVASDLHLEFLAQAERDVFRLPDVEADVLVLAGDIHQHTHGLTWAATTGVANVIYVPGNHEFYNAHLHGLSVQLGQIANELSPPVHLLDNRAVVINGVRFLGTTLWTDFSLNGPGPAQFAALLAAKSIMADFSCIRYGSTGWFLPPQSVILHRAAIEWLSKELAAPFEGPTVVVTHHCPHPASVPERFKGSVLTPAFCSDLTWVMDRYHPALWIHGHTHDAFDYVVDWSDGSGGTRVVCNPGGYPDELEAGFDPAKHVMVTL